jgi:excisionase family DNA binding protein
MSETPLLTVAEAAEYLKISRAQVYLLVKIKEFPAVWIGGWKVRKDKLDSWFDFLMEDKPDNL